MPGQIGQQASPVQMSQTGATNFNANAVPASYLSQAASDLGSGIGNAALLYGIGKAPAVSPEVMLNPSSYDALYGDYSFNMGVPLTGYP